MTIIFDGRKLAAEQEEELKKNVLDFKVKTGVAPKLVDIIIGWDSASVLYARMKGRVAKRIGMVMDIIGLPEKVETQEVIERIKQLNNDSKVHGILVQLPLPEQFLSSGIQESVLNTISPQKDVDCMTSENLEFLRSGKPQFLPATVRGILQIISNSQFPIPNSKVCIVGASGMVGKPLADYLQNQRVNVVRCDEFTEDLAAETKRVDLLISATGVPSLIRKEMVKPGAVIIDVGSPKGDIDFENVKDIASFITPVPGGVGPMTIVSLLENTLSSAKNLPTP